MAVLLATVVSAPAQASQLVARHTSAERLSVSPDGRAIVTFRADGRLRHVLVWGAVDARMPSTSRKQVEFQIDYSGGWKRFGQPLWKARRNACGKYAGPALPWGRRQLHGS